MDLSEETSHSNEFKKCFAIKHVLCPLNIVYNTFNSNVLFWNKYKVYVYEDTRLEESNKCFIPEFQIQQIIALSNCIICLDTSGNVHTTPLKFKSSATGKFKIIFQPRVSNTLQLFHTTENYIFAIKQESNEYFFCVHKGTAELPLVRKIQLSLDNNDLSKPTLSNCIFKSYSVQKDHYDHIRKILKTEICGDSCLNFISFDRRTIYCFLISLKSTIEQVKIEKLYTGPSKICEIQVQMTDDIQVLIGLTVGAVIRLSLQTKELNIAYLNTALHRFDCTRNLIFYTDGNSMRRAENVFSAEKKYSELSVKSVKDFVRIGNQMIATTYNNTIYVYSEIESLLKRSYEEIDYSPADKILGNLHYLDKILEEIERNKQCIKNLELEKIYLTALSLSNRQDIVSKMIKCTVAVYFNYQDAIKCSKPVLTKDIKEYFKENSILFAIKIDLGELKNQFDKMVLNLKNLKIHFTFECCGSMVKSNSVNVKALSEDINILVPMVSKKIANEMIIYVKLTTEVPGVFDSKCSTFVTLYKNILHLKPECFIKTNDNEKIVALKDISNLEHLLVKTAANMHGNLFKLKNDSQKAHTWAFYIKLPKNFEKIFKDCNFIDELKLENIKNDEFIKSKTNITFFILQTQVNIEIHKEEFVNNYKLKISSNDVRIGHSVRNYVSNLIQNYVEVINLDFGFVNSKLYTVTENLQKQFRKCINNSEFENITSIVEEYHKYVIGALNI